MAKYKKCPRCELNYIPATEDYCDVCKHELGKANIQLLDDVDDATMYQENVCPVCKSNFLEDDEKICKKCQAKKNKVKITEEKDVEDDENTWRDFIDDNEPTVKDDESSDGDKPKSVSLAMMQEEEEQQNLEAEEGYDDFD